jgi:hypothetical protein
MNLVRDMVPELTAALFLLIMGAAMLLTFLFSR